MRYQIYILIILSMIAENVSAFEYNNKEHKFSIKVPEGYSIIQESNSSEQGLIVRFARNAEECFEIHHFWITEGNKVYDKKKFLDISDKEFLKPIDFEKCIEKEELQGKGFDKATIYKANNGQYVKIYHYLGDGFNIYIFLATATSKDTFSDTDDMVSSFSRKNFWITLILVVLGVGTPAFLFFLAKEHWGKNWRKVFLYGIIPFVTMIAVCLLCDLSLWWVIIALIAGLFGEIII